MSNVHKTLTERKSKIKTKTKMETKFSECDANKLDETWLWLRLEIACTFGR